uniref:Uncharacterized protein n=1 Tax=Gossypium raimondii TaxID=29730 RepID=A0A0D2R2G3_GOSRA|nr:hypothetical protein B456_002G079800 [Gossypium raimondii]
MDCSLGKLLRSLARIFSKTNDSNVFIISIAVILINQVAGYAVGGGHALHMVGSFDAGYGSSIMSRLVGPKKAHQMWFLARFYTASKVEKMRLVNAVVPLEKLEQETIKWCREILRNSPTAIRVLKAALNAVDDGHAGLQRRRPDFSKFSRRP